MTEELAILTSIYAEENQVLSQLERIYTKNDKPPLPKIKARQNLIISPDKRALNFEKIEPKISFGMEPKISFGYDCVNQFVS
jgi:hypothetical protein